LKKKKEIVWITWESQRRNREICKSFGIPLYELAEIDEIENRFSKYIQGIGKTIKILLDSRPGIVFCQNPSIVLAFLLVILKRIFGMTVFVDSHNAGIFPKEGNSPLLNRLARFIQRNADTTIVTNNALRLHVEGNGGRSFVLPDKVPCFPIPKIRSLKGKYNFLFICTFASDEPYVEVFEAARDIDPGIFIYVSGNYSKKGVKQASLPGNVILLGFIPEEEYIEMLNSVDATIVLSERENCLLCGAYETVAVEKPMILSNKKALTEYFNKGAYIRKTTGKD
jgi:glycosyltransferase involved in cell wall biosynthesis